MTREQYFEQPAFLPVFDAFSELQGRKVGVTGHRGVLGCILTSRLNAAGVSVNCFPGDITDDAELGAWFAANSFDFFFHFAAIVPVDAVLRAPVRAFEVNAVGAYRVSARLAEHNPRCWLFLASTSHVYQPLPATSPQPLSVGDPERPHSIYGRSKLAGEHLCRQFLDSNKHPYCIGRLFSYSHRSQKGAYLVPRLIQQISALREGEKLLVQSADSVRDILDAETIIDAVLMLAARRYTGTINIGSGRARSIAEIAADLLTYLDKDVALEPLAGESPDALIANVQELRRLAST
jgi:nucleoside-diphosphate-sugar epimerase